MQSFFAEYQLFGLVYLINDKIDSKKGDNKEDCSIRTVLYVSGYNSIVNFRRILVFLGIIVENNSSTTISLKPNCFRKEKSVSF